MSRQILIDSYFKVSSNLSPDIKIMSDDNNIAAKKRRCLSLVKTPTILKSSKHAAAKTTVKKAMYSYSEVIDLSSDDENAQSPPDESLNSSQNKTQTEVESNLSQATNINDFNSQTPEKTPRKTPNKTPQSISSDSFQSPASKKFFSPTKKRNVLTRTPVKRNLARDAFIEPQLYSDDTLFTNACDGMDDKSIFLLTIINKYLKDNTLTHLLMETSQEMLGRCFQLAKPGIRLVCRLYWRQSGWYRRDQLLQICGEKKNDQKLDDPTFQDMMNSLILNGFITTSAATGINTLTFEEYAKILKADEVKQICKDLKLRIKTKQAAVEALSAFRKRKSISHYLTEGAPTDNSKRVIDIMKTKAGICYKLSDIARNTFYKLYVLMYLGMDYSTIRDKQLELVLINDKINREKYPIDKSMELDSPSVVFRSQDEFAKYMQAHMTYENYRAETNTGVKCKMVAKVFKMYKEISEDDMMRNRKILLDYSIDADCNKNVSDEDSCLIPTDHNENNPDFTTLQTELYRILPEWLRRFTPAYLFVKLLDSGIQDLKKDKSALRYGLALDILTMLLDQIAFRQHKKSEWYAEKALILHKLLFRHDEAAEVLLEGLESDLSEEYKDVMRPRANKLATQKNIKLDVTLRMRLLECASDLLMENSFPADHISKQPMENYKQRGKKKFEVHTEEDKKFLDCEEYCIVYYTTNGPFTHGEHWEGRIITTMFYLLFWDIIYTKPVGVNGIFLSHYQLYPLDMFTESFYTNRKTVIEDRLRKIESMAVDTLVETMRLKWQERPETELSGIQRSIGWESMRVVVGCLGGAHAAALCRRLVMHYGRTRSGFPDLTLWNAATKRIKFVEVKTDTDKPSLRQLQWMRYLEEHGIDTGFCYVGAQTCSKARSEPSRSIKTSGRRSTAKSIKDYIVFESSESSA